VAVATVDGNGTVRGVGPGSTTITATSEGRSGTATLSVTQAPVAAVTVSLGSASVVVGATTQATAQARDAAGLVLTGRAVTWASSDVSVATVDASGVVRGVAPGTTTITGTSEGRSGAATLSVTQAPVAAVTVSLGSASVVVGTTTQATAQARDAAGLVLTGRAVTWTSSDVSVATVDASGVLRGVAPGTTTITGTSEGRTGSATLTVTQAPVAAVSITLASANVIAGSAVQATAQLRDAAGTVLTGRSVSWASSAPAVASVSSSGVISALTVGTATITATSEGRSGSAVLTVLQAPVATVLVSPATTALQVGQSVVLQATLRDEFQNVLTGRNVSWSSSNGTVASVSSAGRVTALSPGAVTITATSEGRLSTATVTVSNVAVASVTLSTGSVTIVTGESRTIIATVRDALGNVLTGRRVDWTSSNLNVVDGFVFGDTVVITGLASVPVLVQAPVTNVCAVIAGASIFADDGTYLGRFTNRFDSESVLNEFGRFGSEFSSTSTNNTFGTYGSAFSSQSPRNPFASRPPRIIRNGTFIAFYTTNQFRTPYVAPALALTCNFP
jgi:uncharacterized protein YjdB